MFLNLPIHLPHSARWLESGFEERISNLKCGNFRIAFYYDFPDSSTFRYRVHNFIEAIDGMSLEKSRVKVSTSWFCKADGDLVQILPECVDVLVICRARYSDQLDSLILRSKNLGKKVFFDVDDLVFDSSHVPMLIDTLGQDTYLESTWDYWFGYVGRIREALIRCDEVIVTNNMLAQRVRELTGKNARVVPNFVNADQLIASETLWQTKTETGFQSDERIHLGYFSGSPTHNKDFAMIEGVLAEMMKFDRRIFLNLVGFLEPGDGLGKFKDRICRLPLLDYINLQRVVASTEINMVPLQQNIFTNCKSELKFFEAAIVGTTTVASPTYAYSQAIKDGRTGWISEDENWTEKLGCAIRALDKQRESYQLMAKRARKSALSQFTPSANRKKILDAFAR